MSPVYVGKPKLTYMQIIKKLQWIKSCSDDVDIMIDEIDNLIEKLESDAIVGKVKNGNKKNR